MISLHNIKHWLQTKIYHACLNIAEERKTNRLGAILSQMTFYGKPLSVGNDCFINGAQYMEIGDGCHFGASAWVECIDNYREKQAFSPRLIIGKNFSMQKNCHIGCIERIEIGDDVLLGSKVYITDHFHGEISKEALHLPPIERPLISKPVKIGDYVWIGDNVCIMPGVTLGDNVIVGANAVVTHSFPENCVIAGVPAKVIKEL